MARLDGKATLITGASRGIGAATARKFANLGSSLYLAADDPLHEIERVAAECRKLAPPGAKAAGGVFDLALPGRAEAMVEAAARQLGRIDILVNNAGIRIRQPFGQFSNEEFDRMIAVNLKAAFFASQAVLPIMRRQSGGRIIHVASQMGLVAEADSALYGLTKAALIHLTRSMAVELAPEGIIVNAVSPGPIMTDYNVERTSRDPALMARKIAHTAAGRYGRPEEIAEVIAFLATTDATFVQGHNLVVDGGYVIC